MRPSHRKTVTFPTVRMVTLSISILSRALNCEFLLASIAHHCYASYVRNRNQFGISRYGSALRPLEMEGHSWLLQGNACQRVLLAIAFEDQRGWTTSAG